MGRPRGRGRVSLYPRVWALLQICWKMLWSAHSSLSATTTTAPRPGPVKPRKVQQIARPTSDGSCFTSPTSPRGDTGPPDSIVATLVVRAVETILGMLSRGAGCNGAGMLSQTGVSESVCRRDQVRRTKRASRAIVARRVTVQACICSRATRVVPGLCLRRRDEIYLFRSISGP